MLYEVITITAISTEHTIIIGQSKYAKSGFTTKSNEVAPNEEITAPANTSPRVLDITIPKTIPKIKTNNAREIY